MFVGKLPPVDQAAKGDAPEVNSSVAFVTGPPEVIPPNARAEACVPHPAKKALAVVIFTEFVQEEPSYNSVFATAGLFPPKATLAVCVPAPASLSLAVPKFPPFAVNTH